MVKTANQKAISISWVQTLLLIAILFWINLIFKMALTVGDVLYVLLFFMLLTNMFFRHYYLRTGIKE
jgi:hypothetical protein